MAGFNINVAVQSGNLTRDPELRSLPSGTMLCKLGVAVNERYKDSQGDWVDTPNYFDWTVWGGLGEWVAKNMQKGDGVTLEGRARWHSWENDQGQKRSAVEFTANSVIPRGGKGGGGGQTSRDQRMEEEQQMNGTPRSDVPEPAQGEFVHQETQATGGGTTGIHDPDDIPF